MLFHRELYSNLAQIKEKEVVKKCYNKELEKIIRLELGFTLSIATSCGVLLFNLFTDKNLFWTFVIVHLIVGVFIFLKNISRILAINEVIDLYYETKFLEPSNKVKYIKEHYDAIEKKKSKANYKLHYTIQAIERDQVSIGEIIVSSLLNIFLITFLSLGVAKVMVSIIF